MVLSRRRAALVFSAAFLASCGGAGADAPGGGTVGGPSPLPATSATFDQIQSGILTPTCAGSCHVGGSAQGGLSLAPDVAYAQLVGVTPTNANARNDGLKRVVPGKPDSSLLYHKIVFPSGHHASDYGNPMPTGTAGLSVGQVEYIRQWIAAGAPKTGVVADAALLTDRTAQTVVPFAPLQAPPAGSGFQLKVDKFDVASNFERELFVYRKLGNAGDIFVSKIETSMRPFSHHFLLYTFNSSVTPFVMPAPNVVRDIRNADNSMNIAAMLPMGFHVFVAGSMTPQSSYSFPAGMALRLPADVGIDLNVHYANKTAAVVPGEAYANLWTIPQAQVTKVVSTLNLANTSFTLPANQRTVVSKSFTFGTRTTIIGLTSHTHARGEKYQVMIAGGARDGEIVYTNTDWEHPAIVTFLTPLVLEAGQGLKSVVTFNNTTSKTISFGLTSDEEMDIIFGYYY